MVSKTNQIIIQKVENGFIITLQTKGNNRVFRAPQSDRLHFVATNEKEVLEVLKSKLKDMVSDTEIKMQDKEDEEDEQN